MTWFADSPRLPHIALVLCLAHGLLLTAQWAQEGREGDVPLRLSAPVQVKLDDAIAVAELPRARPVAAKPVVSRSAKPASAPPEAVETHAAAAPENPTGKGPYAVPGLRYQVSQDLQRIYIDAIRERIELKKRFPLQAQRLGQTGTVEVTFTVIRDGNIIKPRVTRASPFRRLNESALETVAALGSFGPLPESIEGGALEVTLPIRYSLTN